MLRQTTEADPGLKNYLKVRVLIHFLYIPLLHVPFHILLQVCQQKLQHTLPLDTCLIKPIQRILKYQLLLKVSLGWALKTEGSFFCEYIRFSITYFTHSFWG